jgi:hypothetical protein
MEGCVETHFQEGSAESQIPPLRFAMVGTTLLLGNAPNNAFCPARTFHGSVVLPFVIPSEAEGSAVNGSLLEMFFR